MTDNFVQSLPFTNPSQPHPLISQYSAIQQETKIFEESLENIISQFKLIKQDIQPKHNPEEAQNMLEEYRQQFDFYSNQLFTPQQSKQQDLQQQHNSKLIAANQFITRIKDKHQVYVIKKKAFYQTVKKFEEIIEEMKKTNRRRQDIQNEISKKQDKTAEMIQKLSQTQHYQLSKVKNLQNEIEELSQVHTKQSIDHVRIRSDLLFMKQYINECNNPSFIIEIQQLEPLKRNNDQDEQLKKLQNKLFQLKNNFDVNSTFSKLEEQLRTINDINSKILSQNEKLSSLFDQLSSNINNSQNDNGNETKVETYLTLNSTQINTKAQNISKQFSILDKELKDFLIFMSSIMDKQKSGSIGMEVKKHIEANLKKQSQVNNLNSQISVLNKKILKINNNSNKNKLKQKKANIRKKNDQLMQLDMQKDAKITDLQMKIQNQKHKKMMKEIQGNKLQSQQQQKLEKNSIVDVHTKPVQSSRKSKEKTARSKRQSVDSFEKKKNKPKKRTSKD